MTNYEKYFGTLDRTAETLANPHELKRSFNEWADGDGALLVCLVPPSNKRSNGRTKAVRDCYTAWLQEECE